MAHLAISRTDSHRSHQSQECQSPPQPWTSQKNSSSAVSIVAGSGHGVVAPLSLPSPQRPSLEVRVESGMSSPAKSRMLWREGFTPREIENSAMDEREVKRQEVIFEIIHTEADYVSDLRIIVDILRSPMQTLKIIPTEQIDLLFGNVTEILELHESINMAFMERQRQQYPVVSDISDVLLPFVHHFRLYARYICNQDNALKLVEDLRRSSHNFNVFWKERQRRPECRNLPMESFLALPFQRLLKYPLLLHTLLGTTDEHSQEYANGQLVADQIDAWIKKIQDARAKLDSYACLDALSKNIREVNWTPLLQAEHKLAHSGTVYAGIPQGSSAGSGANIAEASDASVAASAAIIAADEPVGMWLFDTFLVIAKPESQSGPRSMLPRASFSSSRGQEPESGGGKGVGGASVHRLSQGMKYSLVLGPCRVFEVTELPQYMGMPAARLHAIPLEPSGWAVESVSIAVWFPTKSDYSKWQAKLGEHALRTRNYSTQSMACDMAEDMLVDALAATSISDDKPVAAAPSITSRSLAGISGIVNSALPSANVSSTDIPTISVREVYVQFPAPRQRGKLRRGWDYICSKTENITGSGLKRQLKKYGGGGGKRRATDPPPPTKIQRRPSKPLSPNRYLSSSRRKTVSAAKSTTTTTIAAAAAATTTTTSPALSSTAAMPITISTALSKQPSILSQKMPTPTIHNSSSYVHISPVAAPSATNGGSASGVSGISSSSLTTSPQRKQRQMSIPALGIYHPHLVDKSAPPVPTSRAPASTLGNRGDVSVDSVVLKSYANYSFRRSEDSIARSNYSLSNRSNNTENQLASPPQQFPKFEFGSATLTYSSDTASSLAAATTLTAGTASIIARPSPLNIKTNNGDFSDSDLSSSELTSVFPEHLAEKPRSPASPSRSSSYAYGYQQQQQPPPKYSQQLQSLSSPPKPLPAPPKTRQSRVSTGARKPAPVFEVGSAKLTYGEPNVSPPSPLSPPASTAAPPALRTGRIPNLGLMSSQKEPGNDGSASQEELESSAGARPVSWYASSFTRQSLRKWSVGEAEKPSASQLLSTYCIVNHSNQQQPPKMSRHSTDQGTDRRYTAAYTLGRYHATGDNRRTG
ncbi:hypothetical protein GGI12_000343, partial [Dipsacomyces acuminosporus]